MIPHYIHTAKETHTKSGKQVRLRTNHHMEQIKGEGSWCGVGRRKINVRRTSVCIRIEAKVGKNSEVGGLGEKLK